MNGLEQTFLRLYTFIPAWAVGIALLVAGLSFVGNYLLLRSRRRLYFSPELSLAVALALIMLALFYLVVVPLPIPMENRAGVVRLFLITLSMTLALYNGGILRSLLVDDDSD